MAQFAGALNKLVASEFAASQQYIAIAVHYDAQTLAGLAAHFYRQAEKTVTCQIERLVGLARDEHESVGEQFLGWFLEEQREEVASMTNLLAIIDRAGAQNMLLVEDHLARAGELA